MFDFIRRLLGMGGTAPATPGTAGAADAASTALGDAAQEPWQTPQDRNAAAALAAAGYGVAPEAPTDAGSRMEVGRGGGRPDASPGAARRQAPARGEYDRLPPERPVPAPPAARQALGQRPDGLPQEPRPADSKS